MITQTVFDADGRAYELEPVDAREYLESGSYFSKPPKNKAAAVDEPLTDADADAPARGKPGPKPKGKQ